MIPTITHIDDKRINENNTQIIRWMLLWARQSHALVELERGPTRGNPLCKAESRYATLQARGR